GAEDAIRRAADGLGGDFAQRSLRVDHAAAGLRLGGWVGLPTASRAQADPQDFHVNGRLVRDRLVAHAVRQAYADVLYHGRHARFVLFLELDPVLVDVNVHPAKHEVRFRESRLVHDFLYRTLNEALSGARAGSGVGAPAVAPAGLEQPGIAPGDGAAASMTATWHDPRRQTGLGLRVGEPLADYAALLGVARGASLPQAGANGTGDADPGAGADDDAPPGYALAHLHGIFVLAQNRHGLVLVDMHAAHERITYEKLKAAQAGEGIRSQLLLVPLALDVSEREAAVVEEHAVDLVALGFDVARSGPGGVVVRRVPTLL